MLLAWCCLGAENSAVDTGTEVLFTWEMHELVLSEIVVRFIA